MKLFLLSAVLCSPVALAAQVALPASAFYSERPTSLPQIEPLIAPDRKQAPAASVPQAFPPPVDYKLTVIKPAPGMSARMRVASPNQRYDYKIRSPRDPSAGTPPNPPALSR